MGRSRCCSVRSLTSISCAPLAGMGACLSWSAQPVKKSHIGLGAIFAFPQISPAQA